MELLIIQQSQQNNHQSYLTIYANATQFLLGIYFLQ